MAKVLKFKDVKSDVDSRMKDFEKLRVKLNVARAKSVQNGAVTVSTGKKESKGLLDSISSFFKDSPKPVKVNVKK